MNVKLERFEMQCDIENARISAETFDEFLTSLNLLGDCGDDAIQEIATDQSDNDASRNIIGF
jgi:hypothetical protein